MIKPKWNSEAVKAYETGQGVELVKTPHPHYRPLPMDSKPDAVYTVEVEWPERTWVGLSNGEMIELSEMKLSAWDLILEVEAKLKDKNT